MEKHANTFKTRIIKKPKFSSKSFFALKLFDWYIVTYVAKVHNAFTFSLPGSEDEDTTIVET